MQMTWLGHSCFRIETGETCILIDPFLTGNPSFEVQAIPCGTRPRADPLP